MSLTRLCHKMTEQALSFHHVGLLTGQPEEAILRLKRLNYILGKTIYDPLQEVHLCMCEGMHGEPSIEIVTPAKENKALSGLLKRKDDYMYHVCYTTSSLSKGVDALTINESDRIIEVMPPKPAILFNGALVAFYSVSGMGLIELLEQK